MSNLAINGTVTNASGISASFSGNITIVDPPVVVSVTVVPQSAPAGTLRTITIAATDPQGQALVYSCKVNGVDATATAQPNVFTIVA